MASTSESGKIPIGAIGIALEEIQKDETGLAYFPEIGEARVKALEHLPKHFQVICVEPPNKCRQYRIVESRRKAWNVYREFSLAAGQVIAPAIRVLGAGILASIGIYVDGQSSDASKLIVAAYHDGEKYPTLYFQLNWLKTLGGDNVPTSNPIGGMTIEDNTNYIYAGFLNPDIDFKSKCEILIANGDSANSATVKIFLLFKLKGTETEVFIKGGTAGGQGGIPEESPTEDTSGAIGRAGPTWMRPVPT